TLHINVKGISGYHIRNVVHLLLFTNGDHPVIIQEGDRRYFVLSSNLRITDPNTGEQRQEWRNYFSQLWYWMDQCHGWEAVVYYLLTRDVSQFNPKAAPPMTEGKADIIEQSRTGVESLVVDSVQNVAGPFQKDVLTADEVILWLSTEGVAQLQAYGLREVPSPVAVGRALKSAGCISKRVRIDGNQIRIWICRNQPYWSDASAVQIQEAMK
ncbi:MAG: hypothetical protein KJO69_07560, partial [Gammaproteobacteria bacterium]|nr:hypothetical protein [Gammaproteobacteria bacterium]